MLHHRTDDPGKRAEHIAFIAEREAFNEVYLRTGSFREASKKSGETFQEVYEMSLRELSK